MAGKLLILCFLLAMVTIATCKPRNPFAGLFRRDYMMLKDDKRAVASGCPSMSFCSTPQNCQGEIAGVGELLQTTGSCGSGGLNTVCCTLFEY